MMYAISTLLILSVAILIVIKFVYMICTYKSEELINIYHIDYDLIEDDVIIYLLDFMINLEHDFIYDPDYIVFDQLVLEKEFRGL